MLNGLYITVKLKYYLYYNPYVMSIFKYIQRLERIFQMIKQGKTGSAEQFSKRIGISRRQLFSHLEEMRNLGIPIVYNRKQHSYILEKKCEFKINIDLNMLEDPLLGYPFHGKKSIEDYITVSYEEKADKKKFSKK